ncbi:SHOCT domain-containing protein [Micrococcus luteus]|uniref:SHOCT domain-containing protein n=1 Tax=Micrococcus luteus TaxID=1270 RepID=UPI0020065ABD|nr:SHOCT domain-containing protein [Micrococcus luteus]MCK6109882.1 SHOCT domain-containing protein [Micrococcus luteus]
MGRHDVKLACRDCKKCTNSEVANFGRNAGRVTAALITSGVSELGFLATKTCRQCGHALSLHLGEQILTSTNRRFGDNMFSSNAAIGSPSAVATSPRTEDPASALTQAERSLAKEALKALPYHLSVDENLVMIVTGFVVRDTEWTGKPGLLALTSTAVRVIRAKDDARSANTFTFGADDFSVTTQESFMGDTVVVDGDMQVKLTSASRSTSRILPAAVDQVRSFAANTPVAPIDPTRAATDIEASPDAGAAKVTEDFFGQLKKLGELYEAGILSADEFAAAKARLLDQL